MDLSYLEETKPKAGRSQGVCCGFSLKNGVCPKLPEVALNLWMQRGFLSDLGAKPMKSVIFNDFQGFGGEINEICEF